MVWEWSLMIFVDGLIRRVRAEVKVGEVECLKVVEWVDGRELRHYFGF